MNTQKVSDYQGKVECGTVCVCVYVSVCVQARFNVLIKKKTMSLAKEQNLPVEHQHKKEMVIITYN